MPFFWNFTPWFSHLSFKSDENKMFPLWKFYVSLGVTDKQTNYKHYRVDAHWSAELSQNNFGRQLSYFTFIFSELCSIDFDNNFINTNTCKCQMFFLPAWQKVLYPRWVEPKLQCRPYPQILWLVCTLINDNIYIFAMSRAQVAI